MFSNWKWFDTPVDPVELHSTHTCSLSLSLSMCVYARKTFYKQDITREQELRDACPADADAEILYALDKISEENLYVQIV